MSASSGLPPPSTMPRTRLSSFSCLSRVIALSRACSDRRFSWKHERRDTSSTYALSVPYDFPLSQHILILPHLATTTVDTVQQLWVASWITVQTSTSVILMEKPKLLNKKQPSKHTNIWVKYWNLNVIYMWRNVLHKCGQEMGGGGVHKLVINYKWPSTLKFPTPSVADKNRKVVWKLPFDTPTSKSYYCKHESVKKIEKQGLPDWQQYPSSE